MATNNTNDVRESQPIMGGNVKYNTAYSFTKPDGSTVNVKAGISVSGIPGIKYDKLQLSLSLIETLVDLYKNSPDFKKVLQEMKAVERGKE